MAVRRPILARLRAGVAAMRKAWPGASLVPGSGGWLRILESFSGAWQANVVAEPTQNLLTFSAVYACVNLISGDIAKLRLRLMEQVSGGITQEVERNSPYWPVLRKPNRYQTRIQFFKLWVISKLLHGNTYVLKQRDERRLVVAMYILDPQRVIPLVTESGDIYYQLGADNLSGLKQAMTVPASEIIHDCGATLFHPLVGVSPIVASAYSATQGLKIQRNSATFFENMSRPGGILSAPGRIDNETAARLKKDFETNFGGANVGRIAVAGNDLKYQALGMPAEASQLVEQLKWTVEDVARCFLVPLHMIGAAAGQTGQNYGVLSQGYYSQTLQLPIEEIEALLDEGLALKPEYSTEFDLEGLLRMDAKARAETREIDIRSATLTPNEGRRQENRPPKTGGEALYLQQQNYSLEALAKRDAQEDPFGTAKPAAASEPSAANDSKFEDEDLADAKAYLDLRGASIAR